MLTSLICGNFHERDPEDDGPWGCGNSPRSTKKLGAKNRSFGRRCLSDKASRGKNPYSSVGLDKFSALLSDVEEKKKNIYLQKDSRDIMFVRFVYSGSEEVVPVVVKSKGRKQKERVVGQRKDGLGSGNGTNKRPDARVEQVAAVKEEKIEAGPETGKAWEIGLRKLGRPCYYVPISAVLILLLLAIFGRSFAILCTSMGWYLIPTLTGMTGAKESSDGSMKKTTTGGVGRATSPRSA